MRLVLVAVLGDRHALDQLHDEVRPAGRRSCRRRAPWRCSGGPSGPGPAARPRSGRAPACESMPGLDELDRDQPLDRLGLLGHPDRAHAALADLLQQLVAAERHRPSARICRRLPSRSRWRARTSSRGRSGNALRGFSGRHCQQARSVRRMRCRARHAPHVLEPGRRSAAGPTAGRHEQVAFVIGPLVLASALRSCRCGSGPRQPPRRPSIGHGSGTRARGRCRRRVRGRSALDEADSARLRAGTLGDGPSLRTRYRLSRDESVHADASPWHHLGVAPTLGNQRRSALNPTRAARSSCRA